MAHRFWIAACPLAGLLGSTAAMAESVSKTAPLVSEGLTEYEANGIAIGGFRLMPEVEYIIFADDNVYASSSGEKGDIIGTMQGGLDARKKIGDIDLSLTAKAGIRRLASLSTENSETASTIVGIGWQPHSTQRLAFTGGWRRTVEERGDPEALQLTTNGPRLSNIFETQARFTQQGANTLIAADVAWRKYDFLGSANDARDFTTQFGSLTFGRSVGARLYATATAYVTHRDFKIPLPSTGASQNETTIGGRLGFATKERGLIEGRASLGMFRLNPTDPLQKSRSGLSADISLTVRPQRRTAITLDISSGDVATFKLGAQARADTIFILGVQQEARHNLFASLGLVVRKSIYLGEGDRENTIGPRAEVEWIANKTMSLSGYVTFNHRTSNIAEENFDRLRGGISLRLRY